MMRVKCWMVFVSERLCGNLHMLLGDHSVCIVILMKNCQDILHIFIKEHFHQ